MNEVVTLPAPVLGFVPEPGTKWESERAAFDSLLPQLLGTHRGLFVAIHRGQVVDVGPDKMELALRVLAKIGNVDIHVGWVGDEPMQVIRSGLRRDMPNRGVKL